MNKDINKLIKLNLLKVIKNNKYERRYQESKKIKLSNKLYFFITLLLYKYFYYNNVFHHQAFLNSLYLSKSKYLYFH